MTKKITVIHTTPATVSSIPKLIYEEFPDFIIVNILDDSLLNDIKLNGSMTKQVLKRFIKYSIIAEENDSDALLLACSSLGEAGDIARSILKIPVYKIDEPMAKTALALGKNILVLGTVKSTLKPTTDLIKRSINTSFQTVSSIFIEDAFDVLLVDKTRHDKMIASVIDAQINTYDVIVLAQASMADAKKYVSSANQKILTSLPSGIKQLIDLEKSD